MEKKIFFLLLLVSTPFYSQTSELEDDKPLGREEFQEAVRKDFNSLIGNDPSNIGNSLITTFDKKESSVKGVFTLSPKILNKSSYKHSITGSVKVGESTNIFDFGNSDMPLVNLSMKYNFLPYKRWFYEGGSDPTRWTHKRYFWISPEIIYDNNKYKIFDISRELQNQIYDQTYSKVSGKISFNYYAYWDRTYWNTSLKTTRPTFFYWVLDYEYREGNNVGSFENVQIFDDFTLPAGEGTRTVRKTTLAYAGSYKIFTKHIVSGEVLLGLHPNITLDLFASYILSDQAENYLLGTGLYFLVKNKENEPIVNFGLFLQKNDDKKPFVGFKTKLPINI